MFSRLFFFYLGETHQEPLRLCEKYIYIFHLKFPARRGIAYELDAAPVDHGDNLKLYFLFIKLWCISQVTYSFLKGTSSRSCLRAFQPDTLASFGVIESVIFSFWL